MNNRYICLACGGTCHPTGHKTDDLTMEDSLILVECEDCEHRQWKPLTSSSTYITSDWGKRLTNRKIKEALGDEPYDDKYYLREGYDPGFRGPDIPEVND